MLIRYAITSDIPAWIRLADDVASVFRAPEMARDPEFLAYIQSKISKNEALIAIDMSTSSCLGIIGFSRTHNRISWFGVYEIQRGKGVGSKLLRIALDELDRSKEISVETFRSDYAKGAAAKHVYRKFGFVDVDNDLVDKLGNPICKMVLYPFKEETYSRLEPINFINNAFFPMKLLMEIHHEDLGIEASKTEAQDVVKYEVRKAARAIVQNSKGDIALLYVAKEGYYKLPGGGIEADEDILDALRREVREEIGATIEIIKPVGAIMEFREFFEQLQISYTFYCHLKGELVAPQFTADEVSEGFTPVWRSLEDALEAISAYKGSQYMAKFVSLRDYKLLSELKNLDL